MSTNFLCLASPRTANCPLPASFTRIGKNPVGNVRRIAIQVSTSGLLFRVRIPPKSHSKPWRDSSNEERLNGKNGLLLTPSIDHLFDRGFIGFEDSGTLIISPAAHKPSLQRMGVETNSRINVGSFTSGQRQFLDFHRNSVLLRVAR
jgi:hypothetical protein